MRAGATLLDMLVVNRFRVTDEDAFVPRAEAVVEFLAGCQGNLGADLLRNLDEPDLWCIASRWVNVGSYRRSFNGYQAKVTLVPLLSEAVDEPGAYDHPRDVGENLPRAR